MQNDEFTRVYLPKYAGVIRAIARKLAKTNDTLVDDLYQEGLICLWQCDPTKATRNVDAFIRQAVKFRMIDYLRRVRLWRTESLDAHLDGGQQLMFNEVGEPELTNLGDVYWTRREGIPPHTLGDEE